MEGVAGSSADAAENVVTGCVPGGKVDVSGLGRRGRLLKC